ncbi:hypothetical protein AM342_27535 (plasmid) [Escherichia coli]|nr:hypothetical protein AM342_27535 [Escherichia coli]EEW2448015.1 hypothetical protein [Escherichia coli]
MLPVLPAFLSYDKATVQNVMLGAIEKRFGDKVPEQSIQWLTDNGSAYRAHAPPKEANFPAMS